MGKILLPKQYHPDFATPGKKPIGPVKLDPTNPYTPEMIGFWMLRGLTEENLKTGVVTTPSPTPPVVDRPVGISFDNSVTNPTETSWLDTHIKESPSNTLTLAFALRLDTTRSGMDGNYSHQIAKGAVFTNSTDFAFGVRSDSTVANRKLFFYSRSSGGSLSGAEGGSGSFNPDVGEVLTGAVVFNNGSIQFFVGGKVSGSPDTGNILHTDGGARSIRIGSGEDQSSASRGSFDTLLWAFASNRAYSDGQVEALLRDPFKVAIPAIAQIYNFPSVVSGDTDIPVDTDTLSVTENQIDIDLDLPIATASLSIAEQTISVDFGQNIAVDTDSVSITENQIGVDQAISVDTATLSVAEQTISVDFAGDINISIDTANVTVTEQTVALTLDNLLRFDGASEFENDWVDCGAGLTFSGDFEIDIDFIYNNTPFQTLLGDAAGTDDILRINSSTSLLLKAASSSFTKTLTTALIPGTRYQWRFKRTGDTYDLTNWSDSSLLTSPATSTSAFTFNDIGRSLFRDYFCGQLASVFLNDLVTPANNRLYSAGAALGVGSALPEILNSGISDGVLTNFPVDDSQWVLPSDSFVCLELQQITVSEQTITIDFDQLISIDTDNLSVTGQTVTIVSGVKVPVETANLTVTENQITIIVDLSIAVDTASLSIGEGSLTIDQDISLATDLLSVTEQSISVDFIGASVVPIETASLSITQGTINIQTPSTSALWMSALF